MLYLTMKNVNEIEAMFMTTTAKPVNPTLKLTVTRDGFHHELMNKVRLNRYDMKFMANILEKYVAPRKPLSPGQNALYEKIVHKYRKQLRKLQVNYKDIISLEWENGLVSTEVLTGQTFFRIADDEMQMYFNFNKAQIEEIRALVHDDNSNHLNRGTASNFGNGQKYSFNWNNATKTWYGPFNVYLFKQLYKFATNARIQIDSSVRAIIDKLDAAGTAEQWTPGVKIINDRMYVSHIAETMLPILETIDPTDLSIVNVERMCKLGLAAPAEDSHIAEYIESVSPNTQHIIQSLEDIATLRNYIEESGRTVVFCIPEMLATDTGMPKTVQALLGCRDWGAVDKHALLASNPMLLYRGMDIANKLDNYLEDGYNTLVTTTPLTSLFRTQQQVGKFALEADKVIYLKLNETT